MRILFSILMLLVAPVHAASEYVLANTPDWVDHLQVPVTQELPDAQIRNGVHYLLVDRQIEVPATGEPSFFYRYVTLITNQSGLDSESQINVSFDPSYEKVQLHKLVVKRDGLVIDKFTSAQIKVLDREEELEEQIYNGEKTINILLDDLRVGDMIDYSFTITGTNPVMDGSFDASYDLQWSVPVAQVMTRVLWKKDKPLNSKILNTDLTFEQSPVNGGIEYRLDSRDVKSLYWEDDTPSWVNPYASVYLSDSESWGSIADWGMGLFEPVIQSEPAIVELADRFSSQGQSEADTITEALQFVQSEVRYVGIELGENSHQASPAGVTLDRRYGDCKDKAVLLISILREKGIKAYPALVSTSEKNALLNRLPSKYAFNHVVVAVEHDSQTYWLDPTRQYQYGKLENIYQADYGLALVLNATSDGLVSMNPEPRTGQVTSDYFYLSGENTDDVIFTSNTEYFGLSAEKQIRYVESDGVDLIRKDYLEFYQDYYPGIENLEGPKFESDPESLRLLLSEKYRIKGFWELDEDKQRYVSWIYSNAINSYLSKPELIERSLDYKLQHPVNVTHNITLELSDQNWDFETEEFSEINEFFEYRSKANYDESTKFLKLSYSYISKTDHVPVTDYPRYLKALEAAIEETDYGIYDYLDQPESLVETEEDWFLLGLLVYILILVIVLLLWYLDARRNPYSGTMKYYPVSDVKFITMWILTWGVFPIYWFYKNWRYVKDNEEGAGIMPVFRSFFYLFWYYPLFTRLKAESDADGDSGVRVPGQKTAIMLAILFFLVVIATGIDSVYALPFELLSAVLALPLLHIINRVNRHELAAIAHNSVWRVRHYLLVILFIPLSLFLLGSEIGLLPSESVVAGDRLLNRDIKFMQRKGIINPGDKVIYFYSDAFLNIRGDGNGLSDRHVFSYWLDDQDGFNQEIAEYEEITDIKVSWSESFDENTTVEVFRADKSKLLLFLSNTDGKDKDFVKALMARWKNVSVDAG
ncbi:MAG: DUF3857 and transglutaminase domain-containing protein [Gammaproteobacteria bacterium]|nr:DUF3857 and transglutaminase domain-containing protein [Gammaproteobacteria bacterium]